MGETSREKLLPGPTTWKDTRKTSVERCCALANKQSNFTKYHLLGWTTLILKEEELETLGELSTVCSQIVFQNVCTWHALEDLTLHGPWTSLLKQSPNGQELVTDAQLASMHDTNVSKQNCHEGNAAQHGKLGLFKNSARLKSHIHQARLTIVDRVYSKAQILREILKTLNQRRTNFNYLRKKQTSVTRSSAESEITSLTNLQEAKAKRAILEWKLGTCNFRKRTSLAPSTTRNPRKCWFKDCSRKKWKS